MAEEVASGPNDAEGIARVLKIDEGPSIGYCGDYITSLLRDK